MARNLDDLGEKPVVGREVDPGPLDPLRIRAITRVVFVERQPGPADLLFMFGSSDIPTATYRQVARWVEQGWFERVLVTGKTGRAFERTGVPLAHTMRDGLMHAGVASDMIVVQDRSTNTFEDAEFGLEEVRREGLNPASVLFVSKAHHAGRCLRTLRVHLPDADLRASTYDYVYDGCTVSASDWWQHAVARRRVYAEYLKITTYPELQGDNG